MHKKFVADIVALQKQTQAGKATNSVNVLNLLRDWLVNHIQKTDKLYSEHLNTAGIR
jgi:methyl-accepting chemotaxis protein/hemerythrin